MSIDAKEKSSYDSTSIELYYFTCNTQYWANTSWDQDVLNSNVNYLSYFPIKRNEPEFSGEANHAQLQVSTSLEHPVVEMLVTGAPHDPIWLTVYRTMLGETEKIVRWQGKVIGVKINADKRTAILTCEPVEKLQGKSAFRQTYGPMCRKRLYSTSCGVSETEHAVDFTVETVTTNGLVITSPAFGGRADNWWRFGDIWIPGLRRWGSIERSSGNSITLRAKVSGLEVGHSGKIRPGCDHIFKRSNGDWGDCKGKFDNSINFGGFAFSGLKNPYVLGLEG